MKLPRHGCKVFIIGISAAGFTVMAPGKVVDEYFITPDEVMAYNTRRTGNRVRNRMCKFYDNIIFLDPDFSISKMIKHPKKSELPQYYKVAFTITFQGLLFAMAALCSSIYL